MVKLIRCPVSGADECNEALRQFGKPMLTSLSGMNADGEGSNLEIHHPADSNSPDLGSRPIQNSQSACPLCSDHKS
jgi:hypothetical protein